MRPEKATAGLVTPKPVDGIKPDGSWTEDKLAGHNVTSNFPIEPNFMNVLIFIDQVTSEMATAGLSIKQILYEAGLTFSEKENETENENEDEQSSDLDAKPKALEFKNESDALLSIQQSAESLYEMAETQGKMNKSLEKLVSIQERSFNKGPTPDVREINLL